MKILFNDQNIDGDYTAKVFLGWYTNPTVDQMLLLGFTQEESEQLLKGEVIEVDGVYGEFYFKDYPEGCIFENLTEDRDDNV